MIVQRRKLRHAKGGQQRLAAAAATAVSFPPPSTAAPHMRPPHFVSTCIFEEACTGIDVRCHGRPADLNNPPLRRAVRPSDALQLPCPPQRCACCSCVSGACCCCCRCCCCCACPCCAWCAACCARGLPMRPQHGCGRRASSCERSAGSSMDGRMWGPPWYSCSGQAPQQAGRAGAGQGRRAPEAGVWQQSKPGGLASQLCPVPSRPTRHPPAAPGAP